MNPILVESTYCHLWTDALHVRQLSREAPNRWDRGTYVRLCVVLAWTALEIACQEALNAPDIGYSFKANLDRAVADKSLNPLDWSQGVWQEVRRIQELRKSYVHKFASLADMFPESSVADDVIAVVRAAIGSIFDHASVTRPDWIDFDQSRGWAGRSGISDSATATLISAGTSLDDPTAVRICFVADGAEHLSSVHPQGFSYGSEVDRLVRAVSIPISAVWVYEGKTLARELLVHMRGNG
ncbi:MAG: hypothetical protein E8D46_15645 [Nitrospira sp.]|nr:MAG: hypothetical protein E8D46_15645 [Nitrospira sp.]